ncbi:penicillin acylase family protein [Sporosarcina obsidiansis]|uniref:penicillin acylase family protein n=1 Tax=Sporosarcina obsidiansis TaxID=2660748 RepID=UPI00129B55AD|nr:penicillin acylase family protein [Sporosarcina obsidiansis]
MYRWKKFREWQTAYSMIRALPMTKGTQKVIGLLDAVLVVRDEQGVPHIEAKNEHDLYFAQGYVQAQDRLFQMDISRRQASGRLSEVFGKSSLHTDQYFRTIGLHRAAEKSLSHYSARTKKILDSFSQGVNAYIKEAVRKRKLPIEFILRSYQPDEWTPTDCIIMVKLMAFNMGGNWQMQAFRLWAMHNLSEEKWRDLFPEAAGDDEEIAQYCLAHPLNVASIFKHAPLINNCGGSNSWVVSGKKSKNGKPLLAAAPQMSLGNPAAWYQMHLQSTEMNVSGVILPGMPGVLLGHNEHIAWGMTNTRPDTQDLYIEKRHPEKPFTYLYNEEWVEARISSEVIQIKGSPPVLFQIQETRHGPVFSEYLQVPEQTVFSLRWTALEPTKEIEAVIAINTASNWNEFEKALEDFHSPTQNFIFASMDGTIACKTTGRIPIRKGKGLLPVPGWNDEFEWQDFLPFDELPCSVNPKEEFIATVNVKEETADYPNHMSHVWARPYQQIRIQEVLQTGNNFTVQDMKRLQMDKVNLYAAEFVPLFLRCLQSVKKTMQLRRALGILEKWKFEDRVNEPAPLLFHLWLNEIQKSLFENEIPHDVLRLFDGKALVVDRILRQALQTKSESVWVKQLGGISEVLYQSLNKCLKYAETQYGKNMKEWKWGHFHRLYFEHPLSNANDFANELFNITKPLSVGGSEMTVQTTRCNELGIVNHGASWRFVKDWSSRLNSHHIIGPGQCGHVKSLWYDNQLSNWLYGNYHVTELKMIESTYYLRLVPKT